VWGLATERIVNNNTRGMNPPLQLPRPSSVATDGAGDVGFNPQAHTVSPRTLAPRSGRVTHKLALGSGGRLILENPHQNTCFYALDPDRHVPGQISVGSGL